MILRKVSFLIGRHQHRRRRRRRRWEGILFSDCLDNLLN